MAENAIIRRQAYIESQQTAFIAQETLFAILTASLCVVCKPNVNPNGWTASGTSEFSSLESTWPVCPFGLEGQLARK
jgi:hypothetical protein